MNTVIQIAIVAAGLLIAAGIYKAVEAVVGRYKYLELQVEGAKESEHYERHERIEQRATEVATRVATREATREARAAAYDMVREQVNQMAKEAWIKSLATTIKPE